MTLGLREAAGAADLYLRAELRPGDGKSSPPWSVRGEGSEWGGLHSTAHSPTQSVISSVTKQVNQQVMSPLLSQGAERVAASVNAIGVWHYPAPSRVIIIVK